jgi:hypothetical protein
LLISNATDGKNPVKRGGIADERFPMETGKAGNPIVILSEPMAGNDSFPVNVRRRVHHAGAQPVNPDVLRQSVVPAVFPWFPWINKNPSPLARGGEP